MLNGLFGPRAEPDPRAGHLFVVDLGNDPTGASLGKKLALGSNLLARSRSSERILCALLWRLGDRISDVEPAEEPRPRGWCRNQGQRVERRWPWRHGWLGHCWHYSGLDAGRRLGQAQREPRYRRGRREWCLGNRWFPRLRRWCRWWRRERFCRCVGRHSRCFRGSRVGWRRRRWNQPQGKNGAPGTTGSASLSLV